MPWGRLEDDLHENDKVLSFTDKEFRVWSYSISFCNAKRLKRPDTYDLLTEAEARALCRLAEARVSLVVAGLVAKRGWDREGEDYRVHDLRDYAPRQDTTAADRQAKHRSKDRDSRDSHGTVTRDSHGESRVTNGVTHVRGRPVPDPVPVPHAASTTPVDQPEETSIQRNRCAIAHARAQEAAGPVVMSGGSSPQHDLLVASRIAFGHVGQSEPERAEWRRAANAGAKATPPITPDELPDLLAEWRRRGWPEPSLPAIVRKVGQLRSPAEPGSRPSNGSARPAAYDAIAAAYPELDPRRHALEAG